MRRFRKAIGFTCGVVAAIGLGTGSAGAQNLDISELAAALALPVITGGQDSNLLKATLGDVIIADGEAISLLTVTNGRATSTTLKIDIISGDPNTPFVGGDQWQSDSLECLLTGRETVTFLVVGLAAAGATPGVNSVVYAECSTATATDGPAADNRIFAAAAANGIMFVAAGDPVPGGNIAPAIGQDILFGDAVIIDIANGQAYSFSAIPFQAGAGANDGDKNYKFDGLEYSQFPSTLATNYIMPDTAAARIQAELILFTLDGSTSALQPPRVSVTGLGWDDDEVFFNWDHTFDCFDVVSLLDITPNFSQTFQLGSLSGHLTMTPQPVGAGGVDSHDAQFGDGNNSRRRPVHGWIVQNILANADIILPNQPATTQPNTIALNGGPAAWGRPLSQGRFALQPFLTDQDPVLDAESTNP